MQRTVGRITEEEKIEIRNLNNHRMGLEELIPILDADSEIYKTAVSDLEKTVCLYREWWISHAEKYKWERGRGEWIAIFNTNEIVIEE